MTVTFRVMVTSAAYTVMPTEVRVSMMMIVMTVKLSIPRMAVRIGATSRGRSGTVLEIKFTSKLMTVEMTAMTSLVDDSRTLLPRLLGYDMVALLWLRKYGPPQNRRPRSPWEFPILVCVNLLM